VLKIILSYTDTELLKTHDIRNLRVWRIQNCRKFYELKNFETT